MEDLILAKEGGPLKKAWAIFKSKVGEDHIDFIDEKLKKAKA